MWFDQKCPLNLCNKVWALDGGPGPWHLFDEAALWILPSGLNLETVKCKEKNSETSFTYQGLQFVCHLVDLLLNSKLTCFNSIQFAKLCKKRGKWFCFLFVALISENIVMKIKNKWQSFVFCRKFLHNCADWTQFKHVNFESSHLPPRWRHFVILCRLESSIKSVLDIKKFQKLGSLGGVTWQVGLEI